MSERFQFLGPGGWGTYEIDLVERRFTRVEGWSERLLVPGFVDIHIHGAFGIDFMSSLPEQIVALADQLEQVGYEAFLPTTVTASFYNIQQAIARIPKHRAIVGFHLEGPFLSPKFPGAQPKRWIVGAPARHTQWDEVLDHPSLRVITLAPELPGSLDLAWRLAKRGVIVSMGHTNATFEQARAGEEAGFKHATHTYNAMRPLHHREAGTVGYALSSDSLSCELIYDRHHVCREAAALLVKNKPADKLIAISDATMAAGMPDGSTVQMWGLTGQVENGTVRLEDGTLAGSSITLLDAFRNLHSDFGPETAIRACCINPRIDLGLTEPKVYIELDPKLEIVNRFDVG
ncbi:MAG: N-acetylglucosamine-6-phosphate deacetylase [Fimbriimonas sp.]